MPFTHINAVVRLKVDVPQYRLCRGDEGVIVSVWLLPGDFRFQVEFHRSNGSPTVCAQLCAEQLEVINSKSPWMALEYSQNEWVSNKTRRQ
ncbi:MAG: DUF4926 domain-containing protein [Sedimentisphaerales bacterium]|nr:DUF4926 domain-containing protein [Sedimentisphaerales bacterium]